MSLRVDARDVLDPDARTARPFRARVVGHFRRSGPNSWDDYVYVHEHAGEELDVLPGLPVQVEPDGPQLRIRREGRVIRLEWLPDDAELAALGDDDGPGARRRRLAEAFLAPFAEGGGLGDAAVLVATLRGGGGGVREG